MRALGVTRLKGLIIAFAVTGCVSAPSPSPPGPGVTACLGMITQGPDVDEIRRLEERGARTNVEGWSIEEARAFFAPEWASVQPNGEVTDLPAVLAGFQNGRSAPWAGRFDLTELDIRVYCDTAIVIGRAQAYRLGAPAESAAPDVRFRYLNVWRKVDGRWLYVAQQYTRY